MNNNNEFNFDFWKKEMKDRFELNTIGYEILKNFIYYAPEAAKKFIIETYQMKVEKYDLIDKYCDKYNSEKINSILNQVEFEELTNQEINDYGIETQEEGETL